MILFQKLIRHSVTKNMTDIKYTTISADTKTIKILNTIQVKRKFSAKVTDNLRKNR